jgi:hypothetical protein
MLGVSALDVEQAMAQGQTGGNAAEIESYLAGLGR